MNSNPEHTFSSFVCGKANKDAAEAARYISENSGMSSNPLLIWGPDGVGKTHLLSAIHNGVKEGATDISVIHVSSEEVSSDFLVAARYVAVNEFDKARELEKKYLKADILLIDDIHFIEFKHGSLAALFGIIAALHKNRKQLVFSSERSPKEIPRLMGLMEMHHSDTALITELRAPDMTTKMQIIRLKSCAHGLRVTDEVANVIALHSNNVRLIEGCLVKLKARYTLSGDSLDPDAARAVLKDILPD